MVVVEGVGGGGVLPPAPDAARNVPSKRQKSKKLRLTPGAIVSKTLITETKTYVLFTKSKKESKRENYIFATETDLLQNSLAPLINLLRNKSQPWWIKQ